MAVGNENRDAALVLDGANAVVARWAFGTGQAEVVARQSAGGAVSWGLADRQGSVLAVVDNAASVTGTTAFDAYGNRTGGTPWDGVGYAGQRQDALTGLYSNGNGMREYDPAAGRFYQQDPIWGRTGEPNPYTYTLNSPTNATDPSGLLPPGQMGPPEPPKVTYLDLLNQHLEELQRQRRVASRATHQDRLEREIEQVEKSIETGHLISRAANSGWFR